MISSEEIEFLKHSNWIEGVVDNQSLDQAVLAWQYLLRQPHLNNKVILKTHAILMQHSNLSEKNKGRFRRHQVYVGNHEGLDWRDVPKAIENWAYQCHGHYKTEKDVIIDHIEYEKIHPFADGNGRTGRMFLNWQRIKRLKLPVLIIREEERQEYYKLFRQ